MLVHPQKLVIGKPRPDELNRGFLKVNIAFTLPPGSYATLVVKRLFHFGVKKEEPEDVAPRPYADYPQQAQSSVDHKTGDKKKPRADQQVSRSKVDHKSGEEKKNPPPARRPP